ncbi:MAG: hypothetical protein CMJ80_04150 [Planctomycetaceae bacterium]|nr:hypothetical protein [Planctomycetaceae bacterium]
MSQRAITWKITAETSAALSLLSQRMFNLGEHWPFGNRPNVIDGVPSESRFELTAHSFVEILPCSLTARISLIGQSSSLVFLNPFGDIRSRTNLKCGTGFQSICKPADISSLKRLFFIDTLPVLVAGEPNHGGSFIS